MTIKVKQNQARNIITVLVKLILKSLQFHNKEKSNSNISSIVFAKSRKVGVKYTYDNDKV